MAVNHARCSASIAINGLGRKLGFLTLMKQKLYGILLSIHAPFHWINAAAGDVVSVLSNASAVEPLSSCA